MSFCRTFAYTQHTCRIAQNTKPSVTAFMQELI